TTPHPTEYISGDTYHNKDQGRLAHPFFEADNTRTQRARRCQNTVIIRARQSSTRRERVGWLATANEAWLPGDSAKVRPTKESVACQPARFESLRSHASAWATIVCRSSKRGCHPSVERTRSHAATICVGSPARRGASSTLKSTPATRLTVLITSSTEKPRP